ncbi:uncharacterized protein LOC103312499 [Tribolium castaneum]|uniref:Protein sleepless n=1 Tax=Tribolium castaneum TaxID=7070 RepID=D6WID9_TRICA|nr:PREDICTED: uncharacterized protein LOC103312499 isoform X2 [Tribolium castaneum]EFA01063.1 hypothetical protein TcasGA2_TC003981 [Tribolium castaneum]|eukprot:XP_008191486.1 PREDICTED: uncharacterized protein LOC103312499 isoform X2 [Tribolium castaneum]
MNTSTSVLYFLVLTLFIVKAQQLECYECEPKAVAKCLSPHTNNITAVPCYTSDELASNDTEKSDYECFSLYFIAWTKDDESGVYRGCVEKGAIVSLVDFFKTTVKVGNVTNWVTCAESKCNVHDMGSKA